MRKQLEITYSLDHETDMVSFGGGGGGRNRRRRGGQGRRANNNWAWDDNLRENGRDTAVTGGSMAGAGYALSQQRGKAAVGTTIVMMGAGVSMTGVFMLGVGILGGILNSWFGH